MPVSRRAFLRLVGVATARTLAACSRPAEPTCGIVPTPVRGVRQTAPPVAAPVPTPTPALPPSRHQEAPDLQRLVQAGELPPVDERLPSLPLVLEPNGTAGAYGGALRSSYRRQWSDNTMEMIVGVGLELDRLCSERLLAFNRDLTLRPNLCEWWQINPEGTELTIRLREGLCWSDGSPFTTEDVRFYLDHRPGARAAGDEVPTPDDYTIIFRWREPNPDAVVDYALRDWYLPSAYLRPFHADFADRAALDDLLSQQEGPITWQNLFAEKSMWQLNPECPVLGPWRLALDSPPGQIVLQRNPYFWQVDPDGRQLPYVDHVVLREYAEDETFRMWLVNGELDYQANGLSTADYGWLQEHALDGEYRVYLSPSTRHLTLQLNLAVADESLHRFANSLLVRQALMLAIDREELNTLHYYGLCTPRQFSPIRASAHYYERLSTAFVEYNPALADQLLDQAGYAQRDDKGYRLHPDGTRVAFEVVGATLTNTADDDAAMLVCDYLGQVGIEATYRRVECDVLSRLTRENGIQAAWMGNDFPLLLWEAWWPLAGYGRQPQPWASGYGHYWYPATEGVAPPDEHWIYALWDAVDAMRAEADEVRKQARFREVLDIWADQVPLIGVLGEAPQPQLVANGLRNFLEGLPYDPQLRGMHLQYPQQLFWDRPEAHRYAP
ncbi:MAG: ABC transporter substrate-binding protein [Chloroflexi bacterium]|nr:ABC transporter substrate-binding protein [Chloroflexota bacterium]